MTKRMKYNLDQAFNKLRNDYDIRAEYQVKKEDGNKVFVEVNIKGYEREILFFEQDLRSIRDIYSIITSVMLSSLGGD